MSGEVLRWRIHPAAEPEVTSAELVFTLGPDGDSGTLEIHSEDPAMRVLVAYYLTDARDLRPVYVHGEGYRHGPHTRSAFQIDSSLAMFDRNFAAFVAERVQVEAPPSPPVPPPGRWDGVRFVLDDLEHRIAKQRAVVGIFRALAEGGSPSVQARDDAELLGTGRLRGEPVPSSGEGGLDLRWNALADLVSSLETIDRAVRDASPAAPPLPEPAAAWLPHMRSWSMEMRAIDVVAQAWGAAWELASALTGEAAGRAEDEEALVAQLRSSAARARAELAYWACAGDGTCGRRRCPGEWHLRDEGLLDLAQGLREAALRLLGRAQTSSTG